MKPKQAARITSLFTDPARLDSMLVSDFMADLVTH
jgi:hypothetical protein